MLFRILARLFLKQGDKAIAILAQAESGTASCYRRLLEVNRPNRIYLHNRTELLRKIAKKEYSHAKQLITLLDNASPEIKARPYFDERENWTPQTAFTLGLSTFRSWRFLFGPSLFDMGEVHLFWTIAQIELLHGEFYRALSRATPSEAARKVFLAIASDEDEHAAALQAYLSDEDRDWLWIRLPIAIALFVAFDWPRILKRDFGAELG